MYNVEKEEVNKLCKTNIGSSMIATNMSFNKSPTAKLACFTNCIYDTYCFMYNFTRTVITLTILFDPFFLTNGTIMFGVDAKLVCIKLNINLHMLRIELAFNLFMY